MNADAPHVPVLLAEVLAALALQPGDTYVDATLGAGGYLRAARRRCRLVGASPMPMVSIATLKPMRSMPIWPAPMMSP